MVRAGAQCTGRPAMKKNNSDLIFLRFWINSSLKTYSVQIFFLILNVSVNKIMTDRKEGRYKVLRQQSGASAGRDGDGAGAGRARLGPPSALRNKAGRVYIQPRWSGGGGAAGRRGEAAGRHHRPALPSY